MKSRIALVLVTAFVTAVATSIVWAAGLFLAYRYMVDEAPPFAISVKAPHSATVGETISLELNVSNPTGESLELGSIDIGGSLLGGFRVVSVDPKPTESSSVFGFTTFYYSRVLKPNATFAVALQLEAKEPGIWTGDVDFCTPSETFVTSSVTVRVHPADPAAAVGDQDSGH